MAAGKEALGSMGVDTPLAVLSLTRTRTPTPTLTLALALTPTLTQTLALTLTLILTPTLALTRPTPSRRQCTRTGSSSRGSRRPPVVAA